MSAGQLTTIQDIEDFTRGTDFLSASGGGPTTEARGFLSELLDQGHSIGWCALDDIDDDARVCSTFFSGSVAPSRYDRSGPEREFGVVTSDPHPTVAAVEQLERELGETFDIIVPIEIGGNNTGHALATAAALGKMVPDGDFAGRAIPEATCITPHMAGLAMAPLACANYYGNRVFIASSQNNEMAERFTKQLAVASFGCVGCAAFVMSGKDAKRLAVPGTLTRSLEIGRAIREAQQAGRDPLDEVASRVDGVYVLFRGTIAQRWWESRDGYMWGEHVVAGRDGHDGRELKLWFKNENHVSWLDGEPWVSGPDVLELVDLDTGEPVVNSFAEEGQRVGVMGIKRCEQFGGEAGIRALGPHHWGFDWDYRPIEDLVPGR
jgi:uncharacterized protein